MSTPLSQVNLTLPASLKGLFAPKSVYGIDAGSLAIKVVRATQKNGVLNFGCCLFELRNEISAEPGLRDAITKSGGAGKPVAFSIADEKIETHEFHLPKLPKNEMATAIEFEIKKAVASPDYVFHDVLNFEKGEGLDVQCVVASRDIVKGRWEEGQGYGLKPTFLETESSALLSCLSVLEKGRKLDRIAILDLGYASYRLVFIHGDRVSFTRSLYFGMATLCHQVAASLDILPQQTQAFFHEITRGGELSKGAQALERAIQESLYTLCEEFRRSEFFAKDQKGLDEPQEIFLSGGGACVPFAREYLGRHLSEKKISLLDPFQGIKKLPVGIDAATGPLWACAVGLSLR